MKWFLANLSVNLVALAAIGMGGYLAIQGREGWGWFLFVAVICVGKVSFRETKQ